jgi:hypothetical protein
MLPFAKIRQYRSAAVFVLLGWIFAFTVGSVYGCTLADANHDADSSVWVMNGDSHAAVHPGDEHDPCQIACDLQASPVVKEAAGQSPDMQFVAFFVAAYLPVFYPPDHFALPVPGDERLPTQAQSLRTTRLTL